MKLNDDYFIEPGLWNNLQEAHNVIEKMLLECGFQNFELKELEGVENVDSYMVVYL